MPRKALQDQTATAAKQQQKQQQKQAGSKQPTQPHMTINPLKTAFAQQAGNPLAACGELLASIRAVLQLDTDTRHIVATQAMSFFRVSSYAVVKQHLHDF